MHSRSEFFTIGARAGRYIIENFDSDQAKSKLNSYTDQLRLLSSGMPRTLVKVLQERNPEKLYKGWIY